jgi:hypothetical protein
MKQLPAHLFLRDMLSRSVSEQADLLGFPYECFESFSTFWTRAELFRCTSTTRTAEPLEFFEVAPEAEIF